MVASSHFELQLESLIGYQKLVYGVVIPEYVSHLQINSTCTSKPIIDIFQRWPAAAILDFEHIS